MWDPQFELLRTRYRVVRYDARGFGRSSAADQPFSAHDDLAALMRGLHIAHASIVGLSLGGRIAIDFALEYPAMVDRLVLAAPGISGGTWAPSTDTAWLRTISIENSGMWGALIRHGDLEQAAEPRAADRLETLQAPVLLLVGGNDTPFIHQVAAAITARVPHVKRVDIPSVGHMLNLEATERFNSELLAFLAHPPAR